LFATIYFRNKLSPYFSFIKVIGKPGAVPNL